MRKALLGLGILAAVAVMAPRPADAHVSISFGLPGFVFEAGPPVVYGPPVYAPRYYAPYPYYRSRVFYGPRYGYDRGYHRGNGWYGRYRHDRYRGDWD